jgi:hypothetical protein
MSFVRRQALVLALLAANVLATGGAQAAGKAAASPAMPTLSGLKARVGQGGKVDLAASRLTPAELAALRPGFASLRPRARTNAE